MEPLTDTGSHDDHRAPTRIDRVGGELTGHPDRRFGRHSGDLGLPRRRVRRADVVIAGGPLPRQVVASNAVLGEHQVEDGGDQRSVHPRRRNTPSQDLSGAIRGVERWKQDLDGVGAVTAKQGEDRFDVAEVEIPPALARLREPEAERSIRHRGLTGVLVENNCFPHVVLGRRTIRQCRKFVCGDELSGHVRTVVLIEMNEERQVAIGFDVVVEERHRLSSEELGEDDVTHRHRERRVGTCLRG